jgi:hypothetical protein
MEKTPPVALAKTVNHLRTQVNGLHRRLAPPPVALLEMITGAWLTQAIYVAAELGIADQLSSSLDAQTLAPKLNADAGALFRLMRALAHFGILDHGSDDRFALTALGECLKKDAPASVRSMALFVGRKSHWSHWSDLLYSVRTGKTAVEKIEGEPFFEWLSKKPDEASVFDGAMNAVSGAINRSITAAYDFSQFSRIADIGGGHGSLLSAVLEAAPQAEGILFDLPHVKTGAGLIDRIQRASGDFFKTIPSGCDAYMFKNILHDWPDEKALEILDNVRKVIGENGKLLVIEAVIPKGAKPHISKLIDLEMLLSVGGKERTRAEFDALLTRAGFKMTAVFATASPASVIEARPR